MFAEIGVQTDTTLSLTAADVKWAPTIEIFVAEPNIDKSGMSTLDRVIFAQECDELPGFTEQQWETVSGASESGADNADMFEKRGEEAEEETEDVEGEEIETVTVADRMRNIERSLTSPATAAGSV